MGRDTKTAGKLGKKRRPTEATTKPRRAPKPKHASGPSVVRESRVARLTRELREALERQTATAGILQIIASSPSDVQPVFEAIAASAKRLLGGLAGAVLRFVGSECHMAAFTPTDAAADARLKASFPLPLALFQPIELIRGGEVVQFADIEAEAVPPATRELGRLRGFRSILFAPLMSNGAPIGMISVTRKETGRFADRHVQLLRTFADQAVIAIENVRLFEQVQARTRELTESLEQQTATSNVLKVISRSAFDIDSVMSTLAQSARELCGTESCALFLREGDFLFCRGVSAVDYTLADLMRQNPVQIDSDSHMGRAVLTGTIANIGDFQKSNTNLRKFQTLIGFDSFLAVPLMREGRGVGVFTLTRNQLGAFTERQVGLVQGFADQAVIAIENVRLFDEVQARTKELVASLEDLRSAQDRLVQTEKLASLGQLTAGIAHEIKNPLNFVNNFSALSAELVGEMKGALSDINLDKNKREELDEIAQMLKDNLEKIVQHGKRADSIVKNMLQHSREGSGEHRPADINAIVDESLNLAYHGARAEKAGFSMAFQRDLDPSVGMADIYPQEITRVLLNLISNGFYATTKRKVEVGDGFDPMLSAATKNLGDTVEIRIRDNGTGIPEDVKGKIFNPFFTTKPSGEGTGLGLSMSHDIIVKQHGGSIDVETELGLFTEFKIVLPRTSQR